ncbi:carboxylating nicotinate-nucleotide diphosphorylase [Nocardioides jejuensis]|uniref:Nicotinate-nucleotide pyrophosphorylase [carboxylating] n=1 Tax=Nocardioides jejuensis TaxID=2502782 RepID=A0A4R1BT89_9ACTN|nr:carboxylating nicotinate-nucleotide diphosphorylase [Nocardioides jejuensis]TCJ21060.1 carboxylating nicotinate-nucleotide diphosphorylase [Nocardioides jejuensis]
MTAYVTSIVALPYAELPAPLLEELTAAGLDPEQVYADVVAGIAEDLPGDDVTSWATIPAADTDIADFVARQDGVVAGLALAELVFRYVMGNEIRIERPVADGAHVAKGDVLLTVEAPTALLLTAERTALNFTCHLSGVATATAAWVTVLEGTSARVRDTRKTIPGYRSYDKYAVRCGGGVNHRRDLTDQALVKDNHVIAAGGVIAAYELIAKRYPDKLIQVEVDRMSQLQELLDYGVTEILLDNFSIEETRAAVELTAGRARLEASGGLTLESAAVVAATGVDFIAVGALTHSAKVMDIAMDLRG